MTHFIIAYHISLVNVQTNYCNNNLLVLDVKQVNKIMKLYYFFTLKALWDGQGKIKMHYGIPGLKSSYQEKGLFQYCLLVLCRYMTVLFEFLLQVKESTTKSL